MLAVSPALKLALFTEKLETVNGLPSISESLLNTPFKVPTFNAVSSFVEFVSATTVGASFIGLTVISNVLCVFKLPSETV